MHQNSALRRTMLPILVLVIGAALGIGSPAGAYELPLKEAPSGNYYVAASFGSDVDTDLLLDTGSGYLSLSASTFRRISREAPEGAEPQYRRTITGVLANGHSQSVRVYQLPELHLGSCVLVDVEAAVFPGADRDILGLNALKRMQPFTLDLEQGRLLGDLCR